ncbi:MAG: rod shape-determining protein RodA [Proteobacteria bacterium]|nr:rod shape-determining protein RodA [Pseudomonadota bacterium]MBU4469285.1 rod shape-determining protein RodA [Pseudomonadota bacterium]MCG2750764.1 rod shape-determining protein RodA [Desulfobacteraceae bacterium]
MIDRRLIQNFNWGLLSLTVLLSCAGICTLYSAVTAGPPSSESSLYIKQLVSYGIGVFLMIGCFLFNYKLLERWSFAIYLVCILLLVYVLFFGKVAGGSRRWINLGFFSFQPSELAKIIAVIYLAAYYSKRVNTNGLTLLELLHPFMILAVPFILIVKQPDLGTGLLILTISGTLTVFAKIEKRALWYLGGAGALFPPILWFFLKEYQKQRILTFLNPERDPLGAGYHIIQSKIAIGSGMIYGKGFLKGTQNALAFLPEQQTDFIFSVLSEEWGLIGSASILILFVLLIIMGLNIANNCREPFGVLLATGITAIFFWEVLINAGMVMGLLPVVGVPLPFISYGGSSIICKMMGIGLLLNVSMRRFIIVK